MYNVPGEDYTIMYGLHSKSKCIPYSIATRGVLMVLRTACLFDFDRAQHLLRAQVYLHVLGI